MRSMVEGPLRAEGRPSTSLRLVPLPCKCRGGFGSAARRAFLRDERQDRLEVAQNLLCGDSNRLYPLLHQQPIPPLIALWVPAHVVGLAVDLDAEPGLQAVEIQHIRSRRMLASEFVPAGAGAKDAPKQHLGKRHHLSERSGSGDDGLPTRSHGLP